MPCNLILDRLVKVSWQAWPLFGPHQLWPVQAIVGQTFLLFLARLCQFWPRPAVACLCFLLFFLNFGPGQPWPGQAGLALWPQLPRFFYPLANMAKAWPQARLTPAFSLGFDPSLPRSGQVPEAREMLCRDRWSGRHCSRATWVFYLACLHLHILLAYSNFKSKQVILLTLFGWRPNNNGINVSTRGFRVKLKPSR